MVSVPASLSRSPKLAQLRQARPRLKEERLQASQQVPRWERRSQVWPQVLPGWKYSLGRRFGLAVSRPLPHGDPVRLHPAARWQESGQLPESLVQELPVQSRLELPEGPGSQVEGPANP
jgi:hypothetical protein